MQSYDYARRTGVEEISWERFAELAAKLTVALAGEQVDLIVGIARAGLFPATAVACALRRELYPVRITRRVDDRVTFDHPVWRVDVPETVAGQRVAVIDEIADTGETLSLVAQRVCERGAKRVQTVSLVCHSWANPKPNLTALVSDALIIFPWDKRVYQSGKWETHPEVIAALKAQSGLAPHDKI
ncbi:MAG: phosphoribosyltransferase [Chloroflexi bacterium]|nr:phosphoribosyltransferase [Chloroflexota bacterium]